MALVRDGDRVSIYKNGALLATDTSFNTHSVKAGGICIGNDQDSVLAGYLVAEQLFGYFSDLRIYNKAKTMADIAIIKDVIRNL